VTKPNLWPYAMDEQILITEGQDTTGMADPNENGRYTEQSHICNVDSYADRVEKGEDSKFKNRNMVGKKNTVMKAGHKKGCNYNNLKEREK
jgi:hypothetical protein